MLTIRPAQDRGAANFGWLDSRHTFSFGQYYDPNHMGFGPLRVINEDRVLPGQGFGTHGHRDMEIISYVLEGELAHRDSLGTGSVLQAGDVQRMSAGTGIQHSEFNGSEGHPVHFLQIWIVPETSGLPPSYAEKHFTAADKRDRLCLLASRTGREQSLTIHQDVDLYATLLSEGTTLAHSLAPGRCGWIQVARGAVQLNGQSLGVGDGIAIDQEQSLTITGIGADPAEVLLFDMARSAA